MRIPVRASKLFDGYRVVDDVDLTIDDGIVYFGRAGGSYDHVVEAPCVIPGLIDSHVHLTFDYRPSLFHRSVDNVIKIFMAHGVLGVRDTGNALSNVILFTTVNEMFHISITYPYRETLSTLAIYEARQDSR